MNTKTLIIPALLFFSVSCNAGLFSPNSIDLVKDSVFEKLDPTVRLGKKLENLPFCQGKKQRWEVHKTEEDSEIVWFICENPTITNNACKAGLIGLTIATEIPKFCRNGNYIQTFWEAARDNDEKALKYFENLLLSPLYRLGGIKLTRDDFYELVEYFRKLDKPPVTELWVGFSPTVYKKSVVPQEGVFGKIIVPGLPVTFPSIYTAFDNGQETQADLSHLYRGNQVILDANMGFSLGQIAEEIAKLQKQSKPNQPNQSSSRKLPGSTAPEIQYVKDLDADGDRLENKIKSIYFCKNKKKVWRVSKDNGKTVVSFVCENPTFGCPEQLRNDQNYEGVCKEEGIDPLVRLWDAARKDNLSYLVPAKGAYNLAHKGDIKGFDELVAFAKVTNTEPKNEFVLSFTLTPNKDRIESFKAKFSRTIGTLEQSMPIKRLENGKAVYNRTLDQLWAKENEGKYFPGGNMSIEPFVTYFANKKR